jgi:hypothetical protein
MMNGGAVNGNADGIGHPEEDSSCACPDCRLPADGPPAWLRDKAVSIWCGDYFIQLADELGEDAAEEGILGFASGFEKGLVMAMIKPEWVQGLYLKAQRVLPDNAFPQRPIRLGRTCGGDGPSDSHPFANSREG